MGYVITRFTILLFFTLSFLTPWAVSSEPKPQSRTFAQYLLENPNSPHVIVIGTGHAVNPRKNTPYPQNYFLLDISEVQKPDLKADVCKPVPQELHGKFDTVILEHLPPNCVPSAIINVKELLKPSGELVFDDLCYVERTPSPEAYAHATEELVGNVKYVKISPEVEYDKDKIAFAMYINPELPINNRPERDQVIELCHEKILNPFLEAHGFSEVEKVAYNAYITTFTSSKTIFRSKRQQ